MKRLLAGSLFFLAVVDMAAAGEGGRSAACLLPPVPAATLGRPAPMIAPASVFPLTTPIQLVQFAPPSSPTLAPPPPAGTLIAPPPGVCPPAAPPPIGGLLPAESTCLRCCKPSNFWVDGEYLLWGFKNSSAPVPLVTTGSSGIVGAPDTVIVLGGKDVDSGVHQGGRLTVGSWLDCDDKWGRRLLSRIQIDR